MPQICPFIVISTVVTRVQAIILYLDHYKSLLTGSLLSLLPPQIFPCGRSFFAQKPAVASHVNGTKIWNVGMAHNALWDLALPTSQPHPTPLSSWLPCTGCCLLFLKYSTLWHLLSWILYIINSQLKSPFLVFYNPRPIWIISPFIISYISHYFIALVIIYKLYYF